MDRYSMLMARSIELLAASYDLRALATLFSPFYSNRSEQDAASRHDSDLADRMRALSAKYQARGLADPGAGRESGHLGAERRNGPAPVPGSPSEGE